MTIMSTAMHFAGLLGSPRRTSTSATWGARRGTWHPEMLWAAFGGTLVAISILMFIIVATGTYVANKRAEVAPTFAFADTDEERNGNAAGARPARHVGRHRDRPRPARLCGSGHPQLQAHAYLAPGMRTW